MKLRKKFHSQTILVKLIKPIMAIICMQTALFSVIAIGVVILPESKGNAAAILNERVINRAQYLENEMNFRWSNIVESETYVLEGVKKVLEENKAEIGQIKTDAALNLKIIEKIAPTITYILRKNMVTGAFIVLDGLGVASDTTGTDYAGFYVRDLDPTNYSEGDADVLMERGLPTLSKAMKLSLDSFWSASFNFPTEGELENEKFFFEPLRAAKNSDNKKSSNFGYWSKMFTLQNDETQVVTYSIPLIYEDGTVFGVIGIDITYSYLIKMLNYEEIGNNKSGSYLLAVTEDDRKTFSKVAVNSLAYQTNYSNKEIFYGKPSNYVNMYTFDDKKETYGSIHELNLYNTNTPFYNQRWVLIGMQHKKDLFSFHNRVNLITWASTVISITAGLIGVYIASLQLTRPIRKLAKDLQSKDPNQPVVLKKINIQEIDELTNRIENLSKEVADASSQISKIIDMTNAPIGIYEYRDGGTQGEHRVLCSLSMFYIMNWDKGLKEEENFVSKSFFDSQLKAIEPYLSDPDNLIYKLPREGGFQWIQFTRLKGEGRILGMVMDVTKDMKEKERIAYERDYDSLTNVYNRRAFQKYMDELFSRPFDLKIAAIIMCDLDNLKYVNDTYGHECGDAYIKSLCSTLSEFEEYGGVVARRSGDEFYVILHGFDLKDELRAIIMKVWKNLDYKKLLLPNGNEYTVRASGGISWYPEDATNWNQLVQYADFAMYAVKHSVKGNIQEFNAAEYRNNAYLLTGQEALDRLLLMGELKYAMQPVYDVVNDRIFGYEMLMRSWIPELSIPTDIVRMARSQSRLYQLERITWFKSMETFVNKVKHGHIEKDKKVFINSIGSHILNEEDIEEFTNRFKNYLSNIVIELTEGDQSNEEYTQRKVELMKGWNAMLAIDDFGSGYNNDSVLLLMTPNIIKIDMAIIRDIDVDMNRQKLLDNIISYSSTRNMKVLAEGVETKSELETVIAHGVHYVQGYYIYAPTFQIETISEDIKDEIKMIKKKFT